MELGNRCVCLNYIGKYRLVPKQKTNAGFRGWPIEAPPAAIVVIPLERQAWRHSRRINQLKI